MASLPQRLESWARRMRLDKTLPWAGFSIIRDLEMAAQLLNLREFAEHLRMHGEPEHRKFASEILDNEDDLDAAWDAAEHAEALPDDVATNDPVAVIEALDRVARAAVREKDELVSVLVECGALAKGDTETDPAALLRALLS